MAETGLIGH